MASSSAPDTLPSAMTAGELGGAGIGESLMIHTHGLKRWSMGVISPADHL
jgi:hypothetical protein